MITQSVANSHSFITSVMIMWWDCFKASDPEIMSLYENLIFHFKKKVSTPCGCGEKFENMNPKTMVFNLCSDYV